jgi:hypothetical protein
MSTLDALRQQESIQESLQSQSKETLVEMVSHLLKTYVLDPRSTPLKVDVGKVHVPHTLRSLDFPALIETLKFHLDIPDLDKLNVVDGRVYVQLGSGEYALDGPAPPRTAPASAPAPAAPAASPAPAETPAPAAPAERAVPPRADAEPRPAGPAQVDDRFRMLELD